MNSTRKPNARQSGEAAARRFESLFADRPGPVADVSPVAPADLAEVLAFRRLIDARRRYDVAATVAAHRELRNHYGIIVSLASPRAGRGR